MTRQRRIILEELRKFAHHPSADEIYEVVRRRIPRISLGTVYRNLEVLSDLGEIKKLEFGGTLKRFDRDPENHYHIRCNLCDRVDNAPMPQLKDIENRVSRDTDYRIIGLLDMALAIQQGRAHRANGTLALHVLEVLEALERSSTEGRHIDIVSPAQRPDPVPLGDGEEVFGG